MAKIKLFKKGDVIQTIPEEGFFGIAIVLSENEGTSELYPRCHMFITPLIFKNEINFTDLNISDFVLIEFETEYTFELEKRKREPFKRKEQTIYTFTRRNVENLKVLANIETELVYDGELPFDPQILKSGIRIVGCGDPKKFSLGRQAFINWENNNEIEKIK